MTSTLPDAPRRWTQAPGPRFAAKTALDALCWVLAIVVAQLVRFELEYERVALVGTVALCVIAVVAQLIVAYLWSYYHGLHSFGSFYEAKQLIVVALIVTAILIAVNAVFGVAWGVPRSTTVIAFPFAIVFMGITRYVKRLFVDSRSRPIEAQRVLVYGAGALGMSIIPRLMRDPQSPYLPVGVIDDDPSKRNFRIASVAVVGTGADLVAAVKRTGAQALIISIADVDNDFIRQVSERADEAKLRVLVVPPIDTMLAPGTGESAPSLRDVDVEDVIGRRPVDTAGRVDRALPGRQARARHRRRRLDRLASCAARSPSSARPSWCCSTATRSALHAVAAVDLGQRPARHQGGRAGRHPRPRMRCDAIVRRAPSRGRLPRRGAQAPADARAVPGRGAGRPTSSAP